MNTIGVMLNSDYNVTLLTQMLEPIYQVTVVKKSDVSQLACDLLMMDYKTLDQFLPQIKSRKETKSADYLPVLLLTLSDELQQLSEEMWDTIDDVLEMPLQKNRLYLVLRTLLRVKNDALKLQKSDMARDKFLSIVTHDLKNPFHALVGLSELMIRQYDNCDDGDRKRFVQRIHASVNNILRLLENMSQWSKIQTGRLEGCFEQVNLRMLARHSVNIFRESAQEKNIALQLDIDENLRVYADVHMLTTVIRNLVSNAIKFTPNNGKVRLFAQEREQFIEVVVADTGVGINSEDLPKLFRLDLKYSTIGTAGESGTGLGLVLCKEFVEKNGGKLWVETQWKMGSYFKFSLPKAAISAPKTKQIYFSPEIEKKTVTL